MKQIASYPCPWREGLDGWCWSESFQKPISFQRKRMCFQFLMVYSGLFLYPFLSLALEHIMAICCHNSEGIFQSNNYDLVSSL